VVAMMGCRRVGPYLLLLLIPIPILILLLFLLLLLLWWNVGSIADVKVVRMQQGYELAKRALEFCDARIRRIVFLVAATT
jgi:hypothetical protein